MLWIQKTGTETRVTHRQLALFLIHPLIPLTTEKEIDCSKSNRKKHTQFSRHHARLL